MYDCPDYTPPNGESANCPMSDVLRSEIDVFRLEMVKRFDEFEGKVIGAVSKRDTDDLLLRQELKNTNMRLATLGANQLGLRVSNDFLEEPENTEFKIRRISNWRKLQRSRYIWAAVFGGIVLLCEKVILPWLLYKLH